MTYVVARRANDVLDEIRESVSTAAGPRARTLATFRVLTADVIAEAASRARRPFDVEKIRARAAALGVAAALARSGGERRPRSSSAAAARRAAAAGEWSPSSGVRCRVVVTEVPDSLESAVEWIVADDAHGAGPCAISSTSPVAFRLGRARRNRVVPAHRRRTVHA